jgi:hypothetical protein
MPKQASDITLAETTGGLKSQVTKIQSDATSLVSSAKSDFSRQTSAAKVVGRRAPERGHGAPRESFVCPDRRDRHECNKRRERGLVSATRAGSKCS